MVDRVAKAKSDATSEPSVEISDTKRGDAARSDATASSVASSLANDDGGHMHLVVLTGMNGRVGGWNLHRTWPQFRAPYVHHVANPTVMCADFGQEACMAPLDRVMQRLHRDPTCAGVVLYGASQGSATAANYVAQRGAAVHKIRAVVLEAVGASGNLTVTSATGLRGVPLLRDLAPLVAGLLPWSGLLGYSPLGAQAADSVRHWPETRLGADVPLFLLQAEDDLETPCDGARALATYAHAASAGQRPVYFFRIAGPGHTNCLWREPPQLLWIPSAEFAQQLAVTAASSAEALADFHRLLARHALPFDAALARGAGIVAREPSAPVDSSDKSAVPPTESLVDSAQPAKVAGESSSPSLSSSPLPPSSSSSSSSATEPRVESRDAGAGAGAVLRRAFECTAQDVEYAENIARIDWRARCAAVFGLALACCIVGFMSLTGSTLGGNYYRLLAYCGAQWTVLVGIVVPFYKRIYAWLRPNATPESVVVTAVLIALLLAVAVAGDSGFWRLSAVVAVGLLLLPQAEIRPRLTDTIVCVCHPASTSEAGNGGTALSRRVPPA